jgi:uncharacterized protein YbjT (DUF2867 family)
MGHRAVLVGATGLVGQGVLQLLLESDRYEKVFALTRRPLTMSHPKLEQRVIDFDQLATTDLPQSDDVFCALGSTIRKAGSQAAFRKVDLEYPKALAERMVQAGARQFVLVSSVGADSASGNFYLRTKGELEDALAALPFHALHFFRPSLLAGERTEARPGERLMTVLANALQWALMGSWRKYRSIAATDVAAGMVAAAAASEAGTHVYHYDQILQLARR